MEIDNFDSDSELDSTRGNTITPRVCQSRRWIVVINNPSEKEESSYKTTGYFKWIYQIESGQNGTEHLQGYISHKTPIKQTTLKNKFPRAHLEVARGNEDQNITYCSKCDTRVRGPYHSDNIKVKKDIKVIANLFPWQKELLSHIDFNDDRKIYWYFDDVGCSGKTAMAKYLIKHHNSLYVNGEAKDVFHAVAEHKNKDDLIIVINFTRMHEKVNYGMMEALKDGIFFAGKYESKQVIMNSPHIVVFSNNAPWRDALSDDRWAVYMITGERTLENWPRDMPLAQHIPQNYL